MDRDTMRSKALLHGLIGRAAFFTVIGVIAFSSCAFALDREQKNFKSPEAAFSALLEAVKNLDGAAQAPTVQDNNA